MTDSLNLKCTKCGSTQFSIPTDPGDVDMVTCTGCGNELGTMDEVRKAATDLGQAEIDKAILDVFGKRRGR